MFENPSRFGAREPRRRYDVRMRHFLLLFAAFSLSACTESASRPEIAERGTSSSSLVPILTAPADRPLEQLPSAMTLEHFSEMRLEGSGLTLREASRTDAYVRYDISYLSNGLKISGIMNIPHGQGPFPLLIFNHGYIDPVVYTQGRGLKREQDYMARQGFAVLHTDYRGHAGSDASPMDEDSKVYDAGLEYAMDSYNAIQAVRATKLPNVDASRVGMLGHSMGGGVTMSILTAHPDMVQAAVLYAPVHADMWENFNRWRRERTEGDRTLETLKTRIENPAAWDAFSPNTYLDRIQAPILLFQGRKDKDVPYEWSDFLHKRLTEEGKAVTYVEYEQEGHEFAAQWGDFMRKSTAFFRQHLGSGE
jgi:uncharacterized protein